MYSMIVIIIVFRTANLGHVRYERMVSGLEHIKVRLPASSKRIRQACTALSTLLNKVVYVLAENFCAPFNSLLRMHCSLSPPRRQRRLPCTPWHSLDATRVLEAGSIMRLSICLWQKMRWMGKDSEGSTKGAGRRQGCGEGRVSAPKAAGCVTRLTQPANRTISSVVQMLVFIWRSNYYECWWWWCSRRQPTVGFVCVPRGRSGECLRRLGHARRLFASPTGQTPA